MKIPFKHELGLALIFQLLGGGQAEAPHPDIDTMQRTYPDYQIIMPATCGDTDERIEGNGGECTSIASGALCEIPEHSILHLHPDTTFVFTHANDSDGIMAGNTGDQEVNFVIGSPVNALLSCASDLDLSKALESAPR